MLREVAAEKERRQPAETELRKTLIGCILPFFTPALLTISMTSPGVYAFTLMEAILSDRSGFVHGGRWDAKDHSIKPDHAS